MVILHSKIPNCKPPQIKKCSPLVVLKSDITPGKRLWIEDDVYPCHKLHRTLSLYNPNTNEVGMLCKTLIKTEYNDLLILLNLYSI